VWKMAEEDQVLEYPEFKALNCFYITKY
jgi:hypothetical protein